MRALQGWDTTATYDGDFEKLTPGGYVCRIVNSRVEKRENTGDMLVLQLEIEEGEHKGFGRREYERKAARNSQTAKWPLVARQFTEDRDGMANPHFKGLVSCVEKSNPGYRWAWDETSLKGKLIGYTFRAEEFIGQTGEVISVVKPHQARNVDAIREGVQVPAPSRIKETSAEQRYPAGFEQVDAGDELPFD